MSRKKPLLVRSAKTLRVPRTAGSVASIAMPILSISAKSAPEIFNPTGVRIPVVSMSTLPLIGIVQAFDTPGYDSAAFISSTSFSSEM
jgi:hypothetical protein